MLLRLLVDEFDPESRYPYLPSWTEIVRQLTEGRGPIYFPAPEVGQDSYQRMRSKIARLFASPIIRPESRLLVNERLRDFDTKYRYTYSAV